jgi:hypothetical protein
MRASIVAGWLAVVLMSTPGWAADPAKPAGIGRVKSVSGSAYVIRGHDSKKPVKPTPEQLAKPGQLLLVSDMIQTGKDGSLGITFADNSRFAVGPNSNLVLSDFDFDKVTHRGRFLTTVNKGTVAIVSGQIAKEKVNRDAMKVRTPVSLLAARGTRFVVEVP